MWVTGRRRKILSAALGLAAAALVGGQPASAHFSDSSLPANDLEALLALAGADLAPMKPVKTIPAPKLKSVPPADCDAKSDPLEGMQGRVTQADVDSPGAADGWTCNLKPVGHYATPGGFRVWRYVDEAGRKCAYYDTSLFSPASAVSVGGGPSPGVVVLDMSDPAHPVQTTVLVTPAMLAPHESLNLNKKRGLLAAEVGNGLTLPGALAIYDVSQDCRAPVLKSQMVTKTGHESGFSPDGKTYWVAGGGGYIDAIDVSDPANPSLVWEGAYYSHGLNLSHDGKTLYQTDPINGNLGILDVSEIQNRKPDPQVKELSRSTWDTVSIPQNTIPVVIHGHDYLIEFDEFAFRFNPPTVADRAGAARIIDIDNPRKPKIVSDLRLKVNQVAQHMRASSDPSPLPTKPFGYGAHYCGVPKRVNPNIVACSFINSGLRVFDISNPRKPKEIAYFVAPPKEGTVLGLNAGNLALSQPAFDRETGTIWYSDAGSGFWALRMRK